MKTYKRRNKNKKKNKNKKEKRKEKKKIYHRQHHENNDFARREFQDNLHEYGYWPDMDYYENAKNNVDETKELLNNKRRSRLQPVTFEQSVHPQLESSFDER